MKNRLLIISHVHPFPGSSGQELRVRNTIHAATAQLDVDFLTVSAPDACAETAARLEELGCRPIVLPSRRARSGAWRIAQSAAAKLHALRTGLKPSNFWIGSVELPPERVAAAVTPGDYSVVLFEYFHAVAVAELFRAARVPTVLDMHNVLWKTLEQRLDVPRPLHEIAVRRYRAKEEAAWARFDGLVTINRREDELVRARCPGKQVFYAPMGVDLSRWSAPWEPATPPRLAYYGGLGSPHNEASALECHDVVMPAVWRRCPDAELWLVGSKPSERLRRLTADPRVKVTGFVEDVASILRTMSLVLCPWTGTYGFRSRIVEVMALGVPVITTPDALDGMELEDGRGVVLVPDAKAMAAPALELLTDRERLAEQSARARTEMNRLYSLDGTYGRLIRELRAWVAAPQLLSVS